MIKNILLKFVKIIFLFSIILRFNKIKFRNLENLNFRNVDFSNYKIIKSHVFRKNFILNNYETSINNFDYINYCLRIGGKSGIKIAKDSIIKWNKIHGYKINNLWTPNFVGQRIINLVYNFDFINSLSSNSEKNKIKKILSTHIKRFNLEIYFKNNNDLSLLELKTYILINFLSNKKNYNYEKKFIGIVNYQLDNLSFHRSYNLIEHSKFINDISEIINILLRLNIKAPKVFYLTKLKMVTILSNYFHKDSSLALFNGSHNTYYNEILKVLKEENNITVLKYPNESNGIFFYEDKNKKIFFDVVQPNKYFLSKKLSASTLAIEFSSNKEKIITNCGALEKSGGNASYLRYSAAHSTIILKNTNTSEIRENQPHLKFPQIVDYKKNTSKNLTVCEGSHNGYLKNYKKIIKRKIYFSENEDSLFGEDSIISTISKNHEVVFHIRFHIMPEINITETNNKQSLILKTKNNTIWTFKANKVLVLEESIFVDKGDTIKTNQIVIKGITKNNRELLKWSLIKT